MLNCLFINPPNTVASVFPHGLASIVASVHKKGGNCKVLDFNGLNESEELHQRTLQAISDFKPAIIGLTGFSHNYLFFKSLTREIKAHNIDATIVAGGHWARWEPEFILQNTGSDIVVREEGDYIIQDIYDALENHKDFSHIRGISHKKGQEIIHNENGSIIWDLDPLPEPPYDLFDMSKYVNAYTDWEVLELNRQNYPAVIQDKINCRKPLLRASTQTGRGCTSRCTFCTGASQVFRKYSPERIISNIIYLKEKYNVDYIYFKEALTFINNKWSKKTLDLLGKSNLNIVYDAILRVDSLTEELAILLKETGCVRIAFGLESGNEDMLRNMMKKKISLEQIKEAVNLCNKHNILPCGYFLIGMPGENIRSLIDTVRLAASVHVRNDGVSYATPYPGTELFKVAVEKLGLSKEEIFSDMRMEGYGHYGVSPEQELLYIKKYNYSGMSPVITKLFMNLTNLVLYIHYFYIHKYPRSVIFKKSLRLWILMPLRILRWLYEISMTYNRAKKQPAAITLK